MPDAQSQASANFRKGLILSVVTGLLLITCSVIVTRRELFLAMNENLGAFSDYLFTVFTHLGDGTVWVVVAVAVWLWRRDRFLLMIFTVVIGTLIVQSIKNVFIPPQVRPGTLITDHSLFHSVEWVPLLTNFSFPSGHTTTAFSIFLLACLLIPKKWIVPVGFVYGCLVAYSRVYLAEHFPIDLGGGMLTAAITVWLSLLIEKKIKRRRTAAAVAS